MPTYWLVPCVAHTFDNNNNTHTRTHATKILWIKVKRINDGFGLIVGFSNCDRNPIKYQSIVYMRLNTKNVKTLFTNERDKLFQLKKSKIMMEIDDLLYPVDYEVYIHMIVAQQRIICLKALYWCISQWDSPHGSQASSANNNMQRVLLNFKFKAKSNRNS